MTNRELLEAAAKAAGVKLLFDPAGGPRDCTGFHPTQNIYAAPVWNPLTDDGDALRLAVNLGMLVEVTPIGTTVATMRGAVVDEMHGSDKHASTRRAIVRAAAQLHKAKTDV